jgi:hypothetical protein
MEKIIQVFVDIEKEISRIHQQFALAEELSSQFFADNNDLSNIIDLFELSPELVSTKNYEPFKSMFIELIDRYNSSGQYSMFGLISQKDIWKKIRELLLNQKVNEYTDTTGNRLYSFLTIQALTGESMKSIYNVLRGKHLSSIELIRVGKITKAETILEKYIDVLNYYILEELYDKTVERL